MIEDILKEFNLSEEQAQKLLNQYKEDKKDWEREVGIYKQRVDNMKLEHEKALKALKSESAQAVDNLKLENDKLTKTYN